MLLSKQTPKPQASSMPEETPNSPLIEGVDYYIENGLYVFTAEYLRKRGYCCVPSDCWTESALL